MKSYMHEDNAHPDDIRRDADNNVHMKDDEDDYAMKYGDETSDNKAGDQKQWETNPEYKARKSLGVI